MADEEVWLDESFFIDDSYILKSFKYGAENISLYCLQTSSKLLNGYIAQGFLPLDGLSVLELGSGVGLTGLLCGRYCEKIVMTDHNKKVLEVLQRNIELQPSVFDGNHIASMTCENLEWGNEEQLGHILDKHPKGFDLILGADICYQQDSLSPLFRTVKSLLSHKSCPSKQFILSYISRAKSIDAAILREAKNHELEIFEMAGTRTRILDDVLEGTLFKVQLHKAV